MRKRHTRYLLEAAALGGVVPEEDPHDSVEQQGEQARTQDLIVCVNVR